MNINEINIIVADDHPIFRLGLVGFIKKIGVKKIREATNGEEAITLIKNETPNVLILDMEMPGLNGIEVCEWLQKHSVSTKIIILTFFKERDLFDRMIELGVSGYLLKENAIAELELSIKTVLKGEKYLSKELGAVLEEKPNHLLDDIKISNQIKLLTNTEKKILYLISKNVSSKEISEKLFVSSKTIKNHRFNILKKLQLDGSQNSLLKFAIMNRNYLD